MEDDIYDNLPDDNELAFIALERHYRDIMEANLNNSDESSAVNHYRMRYMNSVIAVAKSLEIEYIRDYEVPKINRLQWDAFEEFDVAVSSISIQIKLNHSKRRRTSNVALTAVEKTKIRHYITLIRQEIFNSSLSQEKKDQIYGKVSALEAAIDKDRTPFEAFGDSVRGVARLIGDAEREGLRPIWHYVMLICGEVDAAKEAEKRNLPIPPERKRLEPPRKQLPKPAEPSIGRETKPYEDDDIPF